MKPGHEDRWGAAKLREATASQASRAAWVLELGWNFVKVQRLSPRHRQPPRQKWTAVRVIAARFCVMGWAAAGQIGVSMFSPVLLVLREGCLTMECA